MINLYHYHNFLFAMIVKIYIYGSHCIYFFNIFIIYCLIEYIQKNLILTIWLIKELFDISLLIISI